MSLPGRFVGDPGTQQYICTLFPNRNATFLKLPFLGEDCRSVNFRPNVISTMLLVTIWIRHRLSVRPSFRPSVHFVSKITQTSEHSTSHSLYHAPGVAPFAKNTIILSRRGTLELRVHWLPVTPRSILLVLNGHDPGSLTLVQSDGEKSGN